MPDDPIDPTGPNPAHQQQTSPLTPIPFVIAVTVFLALLLLSFLFLRSDDEGRLLRPERLRQVDETNLYAEADVLDPEGCERIRRAQVDLGVDTIHVEFVIDDEAEFCLSPSDGSLGRLALGATIELPEGIAGRRIIAGAGRLPLPCTVGDRDGQRSRVLCAAE